MKKADIHDKDGNAAESGHDKENNKSDQGKQTYGLPIGMCLGLSIGTAIGAATQNYGLWMPMGIALGMLWSIIIDKKL